MIKTVDEEEETASTLHGNAQDIGLAAEETGEDSEKEVAKIANNLSCTAKDQNVSDGSLSLAAKDGKTLGRVFCDVEKAYNPTAKELVKLEMARL